MSRIHHLVVCAVAATALGSPAEAKEAQISLASGKLSDVVIELARQTGTSVIVSDSRIANRKVPAIRGRMSAAEAVRRLAKSAGARAISTGRGSWRLVAATPSPPPAPKHAPVVRAAPSPPPPQAESPPIIVVASKRDQTIDEVAGPVSIIEGADLERSGVGGSDKIVQRAAAVTSTYLGSGRNKLFIRGIADSSFTGPTQATVGQYFGDLRLSYNAPDPDLRLSDLNRVEILEGPQGTLYGSGSLGGIIRLVPHSPEIGHTSVSMMAGGSLTQAGDPGTDLSVTANLPLLADTAAMRFTIDAASLGGYIDKPRLGRTDVNRTKILAGRAAARFELGSGFDIDLVALGQRTRSNDSQYAGRDGDPLESQAVIREGARADYTHGQFVVSGNIGRVNLRSSTGFSLQSLQERYDATVPDGAERLFVQHNETRMFAHETRIWEPMKDGLGWIAGVSITSNHTRLTRTIGPPLEQGISTGVKNTVLEVTGYGEANLPLADFLIASAGIRATYSRLGGGGEDVPFDIAMLGARITANRNETELLPSASLIAPISADFRVFARYQEGFRPGGLAVAGEFVQRFRSDQTATAEIGFGLGEKRPHGPTITGSLSRTRWQHIQADFIDDNGLPTTANIGDGTIWTASLSASHEFVAGLTARASAAWNRSKVDEPAFVPLTRVRTIPNIAGLSGRASLAWAGQLDNGDRVDAEVWGSYVGKSRLGIGPELGEEQGDYLDSGASLRIGRGNAGLTVSIANITNSKGNRFALGTPFAVGREQSTPLQPRTIRIGFDSRF